MNFTPGVVSAMRGRWVNASFVAIFFVGSCWAYRATGLWGAHFFVAGLVAFSALWLWLIVRGLQQIQKNRGQLSLWKGLGAFLIINFVLQALLSLCPAGNSFAVNGNLSLAPYLAADDLVYLNQWNRKPDFGDVIAFERNGEIDLGLVCGLPGDDVQYEAGQLRRNHQQVQCGIDEIQRPQGLTTVIHAVQPGQLFILKSNGTDSFDWQQGIPESTVVGRMVFRLRDAPFAKFLHLLL